MTFEIPLDVLRAAPIGMVVLSHDGSIQWTNDVMRSLIGDVMSAGTGAN